MKLIIAGSRSLEGIVDIMDIDALVKDHFLLPNEVVCGMAKGIDLIGKKWADEYSPDWTDDPIPIFVVEFPALWDKHGKKAGYMRNGYMAEYADALLAIWDGKSNGTRHMIQCMITHEKPFHVELIS